MFTTDRGANIIAALSDNTRVDCAAHLINTVLRNAFDEKKNCPIEITRLVDTCKSLVQYVKRTSLQNLLSKSLIQSCDTRWNSAFMMLESVLERFDEVEQLLLKHAPAEIRRITAVDVDLLKELVPFLKVIEVK